MIYSKPKLKTNNKRASFVLGNTEYEVSGTVL